MPAPVVWNNIPIGWDRDPKSITVGSVKEHNLFLGPAERADVIIDFSAFAGKTIILYNDGPAAVPAADSRLDYYTSDLDQTATGGSTKTLPGYGPSTRTIMQIKVSATAPAPAYNLAALQAEFATTATHQGVFKRSQDQIIVPQDTYNSAYNSSFPAGTTAYARISSNSLTFTPIGAAGPVTINFKPKAIQELFEDIYGRMMAFLGVEIPNTNGTNQTTIHYGYIDPVTEVLDDTTTGVQIGAAGDGTQIWKITHNGVDTHPIHFHLFNVQLINRVDWAGVVKPPDPNELGWKETVRMNPLEDVIVAMRPIAPKDPFGVPDSIRPLDPTSAIGSTMGFRNVNPDGTPTTPRLTNQLVNFGWEYVWHCHILSHEEMDMMRAMKFNVGRALPAAPVLTGGQGTSAVNLTWTDGTPWAPQTQTPASTLGNPANEIGFRIERAAGNGAFSGIGTALANATTFADSTVPVSGTYRYRVTAYNAAGDSVSNILTVDTTAVGPAITAISPASGPISGGTSVVITGTNLTGATAVTFGATPATGFTVNSATQITATAPAGAAGTVDVTVTTAGGTSAISVADRYTYVATPTVTGLLPSSGPISGGTSVVITGTNLTGATAVTFGATPATGFTVNSATQITATAPAGAAGTVDVTVTAAGGTSAISVADRYTYLLATTRYEQTDPAIVYAPASPSTAWVTASNTSASAGSWRYTNTAGGSVTAIFNGTSLSWVTVKSPSYGIARVTLDAGAPVTVDLYSASALWQQTVWTTGTLTAGTHTVKIEWTGTKNPAATATNVGVDAFNVAGSLVSVVSATRYEQTDSRILYTPASPSTAWVTASNTSASAGSWRYTNTAGGSVTAMFNGTSLSWITVKSPSYGIARVTLDGGAPVTVDLYSASALWQQTVWTTGTLTAGTHTVKIEWTGTKNPAATATNVGVDAFNVIGSLIGATRYEQTDSRILYTPASPSTAWVTASNTSASAGSWRYTNTAGGSVTAIFNGTSLSWVTVKSPSYGIARVTLDAGAPVTVDLYSASALWRQTVWTTGTLTAGTHTVKIEWTGTKNPAATATNVGVDAFDVIGSLQ